MWCTSTAAIAQYGAWPDASADHTRSHLIVCFAKSTAAVRGTIAAIIASSPSRVPTLASTVPVLFWSG